MAHAWKPSGRKFFVRAKPGPGLSYTCSCLAGPPPTPGYTILGAQKTGDGVYRSELEADLLWTGNSSRLARVDRHASHVPQGSKGTPMRCDTPWWVLATWLAGGMNRSHWARPPQGCNVSKTGQHLRTRDPSIARAMVGGSATHLRHRA